MPQAAPVIMAIAAVVGAAAAVKSGQDQKKAAKVQGQVLEQQALRERQEGAVREKNKRRQIVRDIGSVRAGQGGLRDSSLLAAEDFVQESELAALTLRSNSEVGATRLEQRASQVRFAGQQKADAGLARGGSLLLSGAGKFAKS